MARHPFLRIAILALSLPLSLQPAPAQAEDGRHWRDGPRHHIGDRGHCRDGERCRPRHFGRDHRRDRDNDDDVGAGIVLGILGLAVGAMILDAAKDGEERRRGDALDRARADWIARCASRYRSFDARSGTFIGRDGRRYACR